VELAHGQGSAQGYGLPFDAEKTRTAQACFAAWQSGAIAIELALLKGCVKFVDIITTCCIYI
jgi:hypothetical protein